MNHNVIWAGSGILKVLAEYNVLKALEGGWGSVKTKRENVVLPVSLFDTEG